MERVGLVMGEMRSASYTAGYFSSILESRR